MKWLARDIKRTPKQNETRLRRKFAWLPIYISGYILWLTNYEVLEMWESIIIENIEFEGETLNFSVGNWITLSKRTIIK